jgi:hypothetical protein
MSHWFDNAAVELATGRGVTRREGLRRAAAVVMVGGPLAAIAAARRPAVAVAQATDACMQCHRKAKSEAARGARDCQRSFKANLSEGRIQLLPSFVLACHLSNVAAYASDKLDCEADVCGEPPPEKGSGCGGVRASQLEVDGRRRALAAAATCTIVPRTPAPTTTPPPPTGCTNACESAGGICCGPFSTVDAGGGCSTHCTSCQNGPC